MCNFTTAVAAPAFQTLSVEDFFPTFLCSPGPETSWPEAVEPELRHGRHSPLQASSRGPSCPYTVDTAATHSPRTPILLEAESPKSLRFAFLLKKLKVD